MSKSSDRGPKIYALVFDDQVEYIGSTICPLSQRVGFHRQSAKKPITPLSRRIQEFGPHNVTARVVEYVDNSEDLGLRELIWIVEYLRRGCPLKNVMASTTTLGELVRLLRLV